jgi:hypothetical protein
MLQLFLPRLLNDIYKTSEITLDVKMRIFQRISHASLRRQMHHQSELFILKNIGDSVEVCDVGMEKPKGRVVSQDFEPRRFQAFIVEPVEVVNSDDLVARLEKPLRDMKSNKSGAAGEQYPFHIETSLLQIKQTHSDQKRSRKLRLVRHFPGGREMGKSAFLRLCAMD